MLVFDRGSSVDCYRVVVKSDIILLLVTTSISLLSYGLLQFRFSASRNSVVTL